MSQPSVALRLSCWYLAIFSLGVLILGWGLFDIADTNLLDIADTQLHAEAIDLVAWLDSRPGLPIPELQIELREKYKTDGAEDRVQIIDPPGNVIYRSQFYAKHHLPVIIPDELDRPIYHNYRLGSEHFRLLSEHMHGATHDYIFTIARPMDEEFEILLTIRQRALRVGIATLVLAAIGGYWIGRRFSPRPAT